MKKQIGSVVRDLTPAEEAQRALDISQEAEVLYLDKMAKAEKDFPQWAEDLFDLATKSKTIDQLPDLAKKVADKKALRGGKP